MWSNWLTRSSAQQDRRELPAACGFDSRHGRVTTKPDSALSRLRRWASDLIDPKPDRGEAWCIQCSLNGGRTLILSADSLVSHREKHGDDYVRMDARWPASS